MTTENQKLTDRASALALPIELLTGGASENRGMPKRVFPDGRIDNRLMPSGHCRQQPNQ